MIKNIQIHLFFINSALLFTFCAIHPSGEKKDQTPSASQNYSPKTTQNSSNPPTTPEETKKTISTSLVPSLGSGYPTPALPAQNAEKYAWTDVHVGISDDVYVLRLIGNGTYDLAYLASPLQDAKLSGRNSNGLSLLIAAMTAKHAEHREARRKMLEQQREESIRLGQNVLLLLAAINQHSHPKRIDPAQIEDEFKRIKEDRKTLTRQMEREIQESHALDEHLKTIESALQQAHLTGERSIPLTPRKTAEDFAKSSLSGTKLYKTK